MALRFTNTIYVGKALPSSSGGGGTSYTAGDGITIAGNTISAHTDGTTIGFDSNGALSCGISAPSYSAGNGIAISDGGISAKVDSSTIGFDSKGALSCSVSGSAIPYVGSNGIDVNGTVISARLDNSTISTNAAGELQCLVSGGGQTYTAGDGISISGGVVAATSSLLDDVTQVISSGAVARGGDGSGGYFLVTQSGATVGVSGNLRVSVGESSVTVKGSGSTGLYINAAVARVLGGGSTVLSATANSGMLLAGNALGGYVLCSKAGNVYIKHYDDDDKYKAVHMGMSATSNSAGIVQPDNSTCTVANGGILSMTPPTTLWASGNAGSEITYPTLDRANVIRAYKNGLLMESGADYVIGSSGVVSYTTPLESSDKAAFEYYPAAPTRNIVSDGGRSLRSAEPMEDILDDEGQKEITEEER